jgi:hypothetical protein
MRKKPMKETTNKWTEEERRAKKIKMHKERLRKGGADPKKKVKEKEMRKERH